MRAIVIDIVDDSMIVANQKGYIQKVGYDAAATIGSIIEIDEVRIADIRKRKRNILISVMTTMILCLISFGYGLINSYLPIAYVSVDTTPSFIFALNKSYNVIDAQYLDDSGKDIIDSLSSAKSKKIEKAISLYLKNAIDKKYIGYDYNNIISFTIFCEESYRYNQMNAQLQQTIKSTLGSNYQKYILIVERISKNDFDEADKLNISPGKYLIYKKILKYNPKITVFQVQKLSIEENLCLLQEYADAEKIKNMPVANTRNSSKEISKNKEVFPIQTKNKQNNNLISKIGREVRKGIENDLRNKVNVVKAIAQDIIQTKR